MASYDDFSNATVFCLNEKVGCGWRGLLKDLKAHSTTCERELLFKAINNIQSIMLEQEQGKLKIKEQFDKFGTLAVAMKKEIEKMVEEKKGQVDLLRDEVEKMKEGMKEADLLREEVKKTKEEKKGEVDLLRDEIKKKNEEIYLLRQEIKTMKEDKKEDVDLFREEMKKMKEENKQEIDLLREEMKKMTEQKKEETDMSTQGIKKLNEQNNNESKKLKEGNEKIKQEMAILRKELQDISVKTYFDFTIDNEPIGRLVINLFTTQAYETCMKFVKLCTNVTGVSYSGGKVTTLGGTYCGMGHHENELTYSSGTDHVFPAELKTPLENKSTKHDRGRLVSMYKIHGEFTWSYFMVMFTPYPACDGKHVVFGRVTDETWPVIERIRKVGYHGAETGFLSKQTIRIVDCGVVD